MDIILAHPPGKTKGLYINPFKLQELYSSLFPFYGSLLTLIDYKANEKDPQEIKNNSILIFDTPAGSTEYFTSEKFQRFAEKFSVVCFVGETVTDGDVKGFSNAVNIAAAKYIKSWDTEQIHNIIQSHTVLNCNKKYSDIGMSSYSFGFNDNIVRAIIERGDRFHIPGITSGCEHKCTFCHLNINKQTSGKIKPVQINIRVTLKELGHYFSKNDFDIQITDENFFGGKSKEQKQTRFQQIKILCDTFKEIEYNGRIGIDTRIDTVVNTTEPIKIRRNRDRLWKYFKDVGLDYVYLGVESFSETQIKRYSKQFTIKNIFESLQYLQDNGINFTIGLILFDPLVTEKEIAENIAIIKKNNLNRYMASLLKEMRYYINSPYVKMLKRNRLIKNAQTNNFVFYEPKDIEYKNIFLKDNIKIIRRVSKLFRSCGYRHSDMSRLMKSDEVGEFIAESHEQLVNMEIDIILNTILNRQNSYEDKIAFTKELISSYLEKRFLFLNCIIKKYPNDIRLKYYQMTIKEIKKNLFVYIC